MSQSATRPGPRPFWEEKTLLEMDAREWEALCDGCALCCLYKLEDEDTGDIYYTNVACRQLDIATCRCRCYAIRTHLVRDCVDLEPDQVPSLSWLPSTCAYRRLAEGKALPSWHPLVTGDPESVHGAGISARTLAVAEADADDLRAHVLDWEP